MPTIYDPYRAEGDDEAVAAPEPVEPPAPKAPTGTNKEILAWVGDDKERAELAHAAEESADRPRKGLLKELAEILES